MGVFSEERFKKVIEAVLNGESYDSISKREKITKKTIYDYINRLNTPGDAYYNPDTYEMIKSLKQYEEDKLLLKISINYLIYPDITLKDFANTFEEPVSSSTIQRYLENPRIIELVGQNVYEAIRVKLNQSKKLGRIKGGVTSFLNNQAQKSQITGLFEGTISNADESKMFLKLKDILRIKQIREQHPALTLEQIAGILNNEHPDRTITKDYVFDCLNNPPQYFSLIEKNPDNEWKR